MLEVLKLSSGARSSLGGSFGLLAGAFVVAWAPLTAPRLVTISEDRYASGLLFVTLFELGVSDLISWPFFLDFSLTR